MLSRRRHNLKYSLNNTVCPQSPLGVLKNCSAQTNWASHMRFAADYSETLEVFFYTDRWNKRPSLRFSVSCLWNWRLCRMAFWDEISHPDSTKWLRIAQQATSEWLCNKRLANAFPSNWQRPWSQEKWQTGCERWMCGSNPYIVRTKPYKIHTSSFASRVSL
jgi:hypothetical protein